VGSLGPEYQSNQPGVFSNFMGRSCDVCDSLYEIMVISFSALATSRWSFEALFTMSRLSA
jgi:hypothetical protein